MKLSPKEKDVLALIARGYSDKEVAVKLKNSIKTIQTHTESIYKKLNARSRAHAVYIYKDLHPKWRPIRSIKI